MKILKAILPLWLKKILSSFYDNYLGGYASKSYSQEGEDLILKRLFEKQEYGFYVDVGAHHPKRFSTTYIFYKKGWRGINIDAMPGSMKKFNKVRPRDINLEYPVASQSKAMVYYIFNEKALNSLNETFIKERDGRNKVYIEDQVNLTTKKLTQILDQHLPEGQHIDFMNVDVEGMDLDVLLSNDWDRFRPKVVLVEILNESISGIYSNEINSLMHKNQYEMFAKTINTVFFKDIRWQGS